MKKLLTLLLAFVLALSSFSLFACDGKKDGAKSLTFYAPDGAPALAIAKFISDNENFGIDADITYSVTSANDIGGIMQRGKGDFIVMPVNAASKLYKANADDPYVMVAVVTHGNLYLVSEEEGGLENLKGKVVGVIGQGLVPDLTFKAILEDFGFSDDVAVGDSAAEGKISLRYFASASDMLPMLKQGKISAGLLPEPAATKFTSKVAADKTWYSLDVQELYDRELKAYPQAVLMVKKSVYEPYKSNVEKMGDYFAENLAWIKENTTAAVDAVNSKLLGGVTPSLDATVITAGVINNCKIFWQSSDSAKEQVKNYINKIIAVSSQSAVTVADDFFA